MPLKMLVLYEKKKKKVRLRGTVIRLVWEFWI